DDEDGGNQGSIHTSIMEGLYKLDYKLKFLRRMLKRDKKMIIQIHALGYLASYCLLNTPRLSFRSRYVRD
ncbi:putative signal peptide-containing protein, partial [Cryptosporidium canis]